MSALYPPLYSPDMPPDGHIPTPLVTPTDASCRGVGSRAPDHRSPGSAVPRTAGEVPGTTAVDPAGRRDGGVQEALVLWTNS